MTMKCLGLLSLVFVISLAANSQDFHQLFVNRMWQVTTGLPQEVNHSASLVDPSGNMYIAGNEITLFDGTNLIVKKFDTHGDLLWSYSYDGPTSGNDYATDITRDADGNIIVVGTVQNVSVGDYDYVVLKLTSGGSLSWSALFNGAAEGNDGATSVITDSSKNIYVTGASEGSGTSYDYCTLKYSPSGTFQWESRYNYSNGYDAAALVTVGPLYVYVTGASGSAWNNWDIATLRYNHSGTFISEYRVSASAQGYSEPFDMTTDASGKLYVTGKVTSTSDGFNIKTMKLDTDLDLLWSVEYDGAGLDDEGRGIDIDASGNVYVTGTSKQTGQGSKMVTLKNNSSGTEQWTREAHTVPVNLDAKGRKLRFDDARDLVIVCGEKQRTSGSDMALMAYSADGELRLMENFKTQADVSHACHSLSLSGGAVYAHGIADSSGTKSYFGVRYQLHLKESDYVTGSGGERVEHDLIIAFNPEEVITAKTDDDRVMFGELSTFVSSSVTSCLTAKTGIDFSKLITTKIIPECHTWDSISVSRLGNLVQVPKFWSMLLVELPGNANDSLVRDSILTCTDYLRWASFNTVGYYADCPATDPYYAAGHQAGLAPTEEFANAHVNVAEAWCYASGIPEIRVGVMDSGINYNHEDLHDSPGSDSFDGSDVAGGYDFVTSAGTELVPIDESVLPTTYFHGTNVAGIISARRNNGKGTAGIAGKSDVEDGVSLFDLKIGNEAPGPPIIWARALFLAAYDRSQTIPDPEFSENPNAGLALHIVNISLSGENSLLKLMMEFAFRNDVCIIAASGNLTQNGALSDNHYPASYRDEWAIKVGANDNTGEVTNFSCYGDDMDFIAPGVNDIYQSLTHAEIDGEQVASDMGDETYSTTSTDEIFTPLLGTSFATPHLAGIGALMMSYVNFHPDAPNPLSGEDIEHLIQSNEGGTNPHYYDVGATGYDAITGYGRPNAAKILERIQLPCFKVRHFESSFYPSQVMTSDGNTTVTVTGLPSIQPMPLPPAGVYSAERYKITTTNTHDIEGETIIGAWKRDSASDMAPLTTILPGFGIDISLDSYNSTSASLTGYLYKISVGQTDYWWPVHPDRYCHLAYTIYTKDPPGNSECVVAVEENKTNPSVILTPNPGTGIFTIRSDKGVQSANIEVFDMQGNQVHQATMTGHLKEISIINCAQGLYLVRLRIGQEFHTFKYVKQ